jgi:hypothetical protein
MARRRRANKGLSDGASGLILAIAGVAIIGGLGGGLWWVKQAQTQIDEDTNCPKAGPTAIHMILFDRSDPITDQQAQRIKQAIEKYKNEASTGLRFDLYTFEGDTSHILNPTLKICVPERPEDANPLNKNPEFIRRRYEERFAAVIDQTVSSLLHASTQKTSPIIESIRAASITSFGPIEPGRLSLRVTMISDMIQNTSLFSQFQSDSNFEALSHSGVWVSLQPQLKAAKVDILYLSRPKATHNRTPIQNRGHQAFWIQLIAASGGRVDLFEPL